MKKKKMRIVHIDGQEWKWKAFYAQAVIFAPDGKEFVAYSDEDLPITPSRLKKYIIDKIIPEHYQAHLHVGDLVAKQDGIRGRVLQAGPYGDQPFQVLDTHGRYFSSINEDGTSSLNKDLWEKVEGCEE